jgi:hypothetical protein
MHPAHRSSGGRTFRHRTGSKLYLRLHISGSLLSADGRVLRAPATPIYATVGETSSSLSRRRCGAGRIINIRAVLAWV